MTSKLSKIVKWASCVLMATCLMANAADKKADPTGTWKWSFAGQNGQARETTCTLKLDGDKLTGSVSGRNGETPITNATFSGSDIAFSVVRTFNGNTITAKYTGKLDGDTIKGKSETERNGQPQSRDWEAKRGDAKPAEAAPAAK